MPLFRIKKISETEILGIWQITEKIEDLLDDIVLSTEDKIYFEQFKSENRQLQWLSSRILLNRLLNIFLFDNKQFTNNIFSYSSEVKYEHSGKPFLKNLPYYISISHSGIYSVIIMNKQHAVGIDIEKFRSNIDKLIDKFLSSQEQSLIKNSQRNKILEKYHICWGIKEALYKCLNIKGIIFKDDIQIEDFVFNNKGGYAYAFFQNRAYKFYYETFNDYYLVYTIE
jgi:phosphopantetheinyl transferase